MTTVAFARMLMAKAKWIYGIGGERLNGLTASVRRRGKIEWLHDCDEEVTAFAAGTNAHLTDSVATCVAGHSPSDLRLNGLFDCRRSCVPVLAFAAPVPVAEFGMGASESAVGSEYYEYGSTKPRMAGDLT
jgi:pyruvate dehydrogenase (quinone)